jgi:hypothetical protein
MDAQHSRGTSHVKFSSLLLSAAAAGLLAAAILSAGTFAQMPQSPPNPAGSPSSANSPQAGQPPASGGRPARNYPAPTNLKVLPKDMSGREVRDTMEKWAGSLGVKCDFCHVADPKNIGPNGKPRLKYADDSKPDKQIARIMYTMTQQMNSDYISKAMDLDKDEEGSPVTCGTCHRGHKMPEEFVIPRQERDGEGGPPPDGSAGPAPKGTMPPN